MQSLPKINRSGIPEKKHTSGDKSKGNLAVVIACVIAGLAAFSFLAALGILYCPRSDKSMTPDNSLQIPDQGQGLDPLDNSCSLPRPPSVASATFARQTSVKSATTTTT